MFNFEFEYNKSVMKALKLLPFAVLIALCSCSHKGQDIENIANGVWKVTYGRPEKFNLTSALELTPKLDVINEMPSTGSLPFSLDELKLEVFDGKTYIRFPLEKDEKLFGLGLNFNSVERRGSILRLHVDHYGGTDNGRSHAPVPFFVSSRGYGAFINSARYIDVWAGTGVTKDSKHPAEAKDRNTDNSWTAQPYSDNLEFLVPAEGVEMVLFAGDSMLDVVRKFNLYNGGGVLPPKWGLGFWHRVPTLFTDNDVLGEVNQFREKGFPLTVIGLEPGWQSKSYPCTYEWDAKRFPDPERFVAKLDSMNIKTNLWFNPGVSPDGELYSKVEPYTGTHTEWCGVLPDYTVPEVREMLQDFFWDKHGAIGISGYKMDENDGYDSWLYPDVAHFPSGNAAEQIRQTYGSMMQKTFADLYRSHNMRTYGLVRAANAGTTSYPFVIYNDYYDHRGFITALINSSFIGTLWTPEVRSSSSAEEWLRRMQTVCFSPLAMLNAWADGTKPWSFHEVEEQVREYAELRMKLIPYLYTAFADYVFYGTPPMRAMNLEQGFACDDKEEERRFDSTDNPYAMAVRSEVKDQFMVGKDILVAPFFKGDRARKVVLPQGKWYDFWTGELVGEGEIITVTDETGTGNIPVFVRNGGIVPMFPPIVSLTGEKLPVTVRHYGDVSSSYSLYDDDGATYDYEKGEYSRISIEVTVNPDGSKSGKAIMPENGKLYSISTIDFDFEMAHVTSHQGIPGRIYPSC